MRDLPETGVNVVNRSPSTDGLRENSLGELPGRGTLQSFVIVGKGGPTRKGECWVELHVVNPPMEESADDFGTIRAKVLDGYLYGGHNPSMKVPPIPLAPGDQLFMYTFNTQVLLTEIKGVGRVS